MRTVVLLLAVVLLAAVATAAPNNYPQASSSDASAPCRPGSQWQMDCNFCRCGDDGLSRVCTLAICARESPLPQTSRAPPPNSLLSPAERKRMRGERIGRKRKLEGVAAASDSGPSGKKSREGRNRKKNRKPKGPCSEGETTEYECNTCRCAADGSGFVCTRRVCPPQGFPERRRRETPEFNCTPNESYTAPDGCNTCVCSADGKNAACTLRLCVPSPPPS